MRALITVMDLGAFFGSSGFSVNIYVNGQLSQQYSGRYGCFTVNSFELGHCPRGGSGEVVLTCRNFFDDCPLYIWTFKPDDSACGGPCCFLKGDGYQPMPAKGAVSGA
ncbi:hypothetical protein ABPG77_005598 [Micractinium sp. CCAP 211/92]